MAAEIDQVLDRIKDAQDRWVMRLLSDHRPVIRHAGDQRDPVTDISCSCKKRGFTVTELEVPYFVHIYDVLRPSFRLPDNGMR